MRIIGFIALLITLFVSLFRINGAEATNNVLGIALMVLLLSLFSDLKEFNFWGLRGKKWEEKKLQSVAGKEAISGKKAPRVKLTAIKQAQAERFETFQLMDNDRGNFLALAFEIERLLRIAATALSSKELPSNITIDQTIQLLKEKGLFTEAGEQQIASIRWLRNMLVHGRENEVSKETLDTGFVVAQSLYNELKNWLESANSVK